MPFYHEPFEMDIKPPAEGEEMFQNGTKYIWKCRKVSETCTICEWVAEVLYQYTLENGIY